MGIDIIGGLEAIARRWYVLALALILGAGAAFVISKRAHVFVANSAVILTSQADATAPGASNATGEGAGADLAMQPSDLPVLITSENVLTQVARDLGPDTTVAQLRRQIRAHVGLQNDIMPIEFSAPSADAAILGANATADELTRYYRTIAMARFSKLIGDLQKQIKDKQVLLARLDANLQRAIAQNPEVAAKEPAVVSAQFANLESQRDQLVAALQGDAEIATYGSRLTTDTLPLARQEIGSTDPAYLALKAQYAKDTAELNRVRAAYSASYPGLPELQDQVSREARQVAAADQKLGRAAPFASQSYNQALKLQLQAKGQAVADQARIAQIDAQISALQNTVSSGTGASVKASSLRRDRESADAALAKLQARLAEANADQAVAGTLGSISVISRAESAEPATFSKPKVILIGALATAFWLALALIAILERFDRRLHSAKQIEGLYHIPIITTVSTALYAGRGQLGREEYLGLRG